MPVSTSHSIRDSIDHAPMSPFQLRVVGICFLIILVEGYDLLVMAFNASSVAGEWSLSGSQVGLLLSAALVGMALGSAFIAPLADVFGRRRLTIWCLSLVGVTMAAAALSTGFFQLGICRFLTGLGIGGLAAGLPVVAAEFSPQRRRATMVAIYTSGLPIGGAIGGLISAALLSVYSWRAAFLVGASLTLVLLIVVLLSLPESIDFLLAKRPARALESVNRTLAKMRIAPIAELPHVSRSVVEGVRSAVFTGASGLRTALLGGAFFLMMSAFYFATSWTPQLLEASGFSAQQGISGGMLLNLGGAAAALTFGLLAISLSSRWLTVAAFVGAAAVFVAMSQSLGVLSIALVVAVAVGAFTNAAATGLFALAPDCYPASVRSTGVGFVAAIGRIGAIVAPIAAGILVDRSWSAPALFLLFAVPLIIGAGLVALLSIPKTTVPEYSVQTPSQASRTIR